MRRFTSRPAEEDGQAKEKTGSKRRSWSLPRRTSNRRVPERQTENEQPDIEEPSEFRADGNSRRPRLFSRSVKGGQNAVEEKFTPPSGKPLKNGSMALKIWKLGSFGIHGPRTEGESALARLVSGTSSKVQNAYQQSREDEGVRGGHFSMDSLSPCSLNSCPDLDQTSRSDESTGASCAEEGPLTRLSIQILSDGPAVGGDAPSDCTPRGRSHSWGMGDDFINRSELQLPTSKFLVPPVSIALSSAEEINEGGQISSSRVLDESCSESAEDSQETAPSQRLQIQLESHQDAGNRLLARRISISTPTHSEANVERRRACSPTARTSVKFTGFSNNEGEAHNLIAQVAAKARLRRAATNVVDEEFVGSPKDDQSPPCSTPEKTAAAAAKQKSFRSLQSVACPGFGGAHELEIRSALLVRKNKTHKSEVDYTNTAAIGNK